MLVELGAAAANADALARLFLALVEGSAEAAATRRQARDLQRRGDEITRALMDGPTRPLQLLNEASDAADRVAQMIEWGALDPG